MAEFKNPAGSFYVDSDDFLLERRRTASGKRDVVALKHKGQGGYDTPEMFGAKGDGVTDDSEALNRMFKTNGIKIFSTDKTYLVDTAKKLSPASGTTIYLQNAVLKATETVGSNDAIFDIVEKKNIYIYGGTIIGGKKEDGPLSEGRQMGVNIMRSQGIVVKDMSIKGCNTDAVYLNASSNIVIEDMDIYNSGRQGISIISGNNISIRNIRCEKVDGFEPMAGIDIEPNSVGEVLDGITIEDFTAIDCKSAISFVLGNSGPDSIAKIKVRGARAENCNHGLSFSVGESVFDGKSYVIIDGCRIESPSEAAIEFTSWFSDSPVCKLSNVYIYNDNRNPGNFSPITLRNATKLEKPVGNVTIEGLILEDVNLKQSTELNIGNTDQGCENVHIIDPVIKRKAPIGGNNNMLLFSGPGRNNTFSDGAESLTAVVKEGVSGIVNYAGSGYTKYIVETAENIELYVPAINILNEATIVVTKPSQLRMIKRGDQKLIYNGKEVLNQFFYGPGTVRATRIGDMVWEIVSEMPTTRGKG